jgi:hypothetical protein
MRSPVILDVRSSHTIGDTRHVWWITSVLGHSAASQLELLPTVVTMIMAGG